MFGAASKTAGGRRDLRLAWVQFPSVGTVFVGAAYMPPASSSPIPAAWFRRGDHWPPVPFHGHIASSLRTVTTHLCGETMQPPVGAGFIPPSRCSLLPVPLQAANSRPYTGNQQSPALRMTYVEKTHVCCHRRDGYHPPERSLARPAARQTANGPLRRKPSLNMQLLLQLPPCKGRLLAKRSSGFAFGEMARLELKIRGAPPREAVTRRVTDEGAQRQAPPPHR